MTEETREIISSRRSVFTCNHDEAIDVSARIELERSLFDERPSGTTTVRFLYDVSFMIIENKWRLCVVAIYYKERTELSFFPYEQCTLAKKCREF